MIVMPANNSNAHSLASRFPGRIGLIMSPEGFRSPKKLPLSVDNGAYSCWSKGRDWDEAMFLRHVERCLEFKPLWVVVPDAVGDAEKTFRNWDAWRPRLEQFGVPLALAVQDGMTVESVKANCDQEVVFVGGTTDWKRKTLVMWCREFPRVHVGRINTERWLWECHIAGAESCDGTGWFRGDRFQRAGLERYLRRSSLGLTDRQAMLSLSFSDGW